MHPPTNFSALCSVVPKGGVLMLCAFVLVASVVVLTLVGSEGCVVKSVVGGDADGGKASFPAYCRCAN
jgi:hypothetical protein